MKPTIGRASMPAALAASTLVALAAAASPAAAASSSWQLTDQYTARPVCFTTAGSTEYLEVDFNGSWATPLNIGASGLADGTSEAGTSLITFTDGVVSSETSDTPVPAGSSNGTGPIAVSSPGTDVEAYVLVTAPAGLAANSTFDITFWAGDGTTTQTETVPVDIKTSCAVHY